MLVLLGSVNMDWLMNGPQSGKTFSFLFIMPVVIVSLFFRLMFSFGIWLVKISLLDILLLILVCYVLLNDSLKAVPASLRLYEFYGLIFLYIALRQINKKYLALLLLAVLLGGTIQALYGNLQLWGLFSSNNNVFNLTGSFSNPGPYAGYLASVFPIALGLYLFQINPIPDLLEEKIVFRINRQKQPKFFVLFRQTGENEPGDTTDQHRTKLKFPNDIFRSVFLIPIMFFIILMIMVSRSRAAWMAVFISTGYMLLMRYPIRSMFKVHVQTRGKQGLILVIGILFVGACMFGLYRLRQDSVDGRILIWKVTSEMIGDYLTTGVGTDQFKAHYMDYQAAYFMTNPESEEIMVAGDVNYAFNELLQQTAEHGIVGLIFILAVLSIVFLSSIREGKGVVRQSTENKTFMSGNLIWQLSVIARAGIISFVIFSLFSYPVQILPIKMGLVLYFATLAIASPRNIIIPSFDPKKKNWCGNASKTLKMMLVFALFVGMTLFYRSVYSLYHAYSLWQNAYLLQEDGAGKSCLETYGKAYSLLKNDGVFLTNYGRALFLNGKYDQAIEISHQAARLYPNRIACLVLGDGYKATGRIKEAEQSYLHAWYMNPSLFFPKYLLTKLYNETGQKEKAIETAKELLNKKVKTESTIINEIKAEMQKIILNGDK